ncbi:MAG: hypothetical protein H6631_11840 [Anaerolineaceae bacterium]|nr:hypothetical protein [Anaerolineaceae bacterium]MCB9101395.1 hypothetical protein [Anaerolineales bacterium]
MITWLIRYGHVLGAGLWVGGYALLALVIIPLLDKENHSVLIRIALTSVRVLTYAGTATLLFGLALITRTRGLASLTRGGEWGAIMIIGFIMAVIVLGIGDAALRPALKHLWATGDSRRARRWAWIGLILTILAIGFMTRAIYAVS